MAKYLKDILAERGIPIDLTFVGRSGLIEKRKKDGGTYEVYEYTFLIDGGKVHTENIFPKTHDFVLKKAVKDDVCRAKLTKEGFIEWKILPRGEAVLEIPHPPVTRAIAAGKAVAAEDRKAKLKDTRISLAGLMQAHIINGKTNEEAIKLAVDGKKLLDAAADQYLLGFDPL